MIEKDFKDRVPTYPGRVKLTPVSGQANTYDMVRADSPTTEGTPLDKVTFESIVHSRLTGRYYSPTVSRSQNASQTNLTVSPLPTSGWVFEEGSTSKATSGAYAVETSSDQAAYSLADEAFTSGGWQSGNNSAEAWIKIYHAQAIKVKAMRFRLAARYTARLAGMYIEGSSNGTSWSTLYSTTSLTFGSDVTYTLSSTGEYNYYRIRFAFSDSNNVTVSNWRYSLYDIPTYTNALTVASGFPTSWTFGQRVMIIAPTLNTFAVTANTLNGVAVSTILQSGKLYELIYASNTFVAKEV